MARILKILCLFISISFSVFVSIKETLSNMVNESIDLSCFVQGRIQVEANKIW